MGQTKQAWDFELYENGILVADVNMIPYKDAVILHHNVYKINKTLLRLYREVFEDIKSILRINGINLIISVGKTEEGAKWDKYLKIFNFDDIRQGYGCRYGIMVI